MARPVIYGQQIRIYLTAAHRAAVQREAALLGVKPSDVIRSALDAYFDKSDQSNDAGAVR